MKKVLGPLLLVLLIAGCQPLVLVEPKRTSIEGAFSVEPQIAWSRGNPDLQPAGTNTSRNPAQVWTADGFGIEQVRFYPGIADGQVLAKQADGAEKLPVFKKEMTATEVMELVEATLTRSDQSTLIEMHNLRPADFGGVPGFRFEITMTLKDELPRKAIVAGAIKNDRLYMILYEGARVYYFDKYVDVAQRIIDSVQFPDVTAAK